MRPHPTTAMDTVLAHGWLPSPLYLRTPPLALSLPFEMFNIVVTSYTNHKYNK